MCINPNAPIKRHKGWLTKGCHISYCAEHLPQASETEIIMAPRTGEVRATAGRLVCPRRLSEAEPRSPAARSGAPSGLALPSLGRCSTEAKGKCRDLLASGVLTRWHSAICPELITLRPHAAGAAPCGSCDGPPRIVRWLHLPSSWSSPLSPLSLGRVPAHFRSSGVT